MYNTNEKHIKSLNCQTTQNKTNQSTTNIQCMLTIFLRKFSLHLAVLFKKDFYNFKRKIIKVYTV